MEECADDAPVVYEKPNGGLAPAFGGGANILAPAYSIASFSYLSHYPTVIFLLWPFSLA
jgi:hypothetical protein